MNRRRFVEFLLVLVLGGAARAQTLPSYVKLPDGVTMKNLQHREYDIAEINYQEHGNGPWTHTKVSGHWWTAYVGNVPLDAWPPVITKTGWEVLTVNGNVIARRFAGSVESWLKFSGGWITIVEKAAPPPLAMEPPGSTPEPLMEGKDVPYLPPLPGSVLTFSKLDPAAEFDVTGPSSTEPAFVGRPGLRIKYKSPASGFETQQVYRAAFEKAGWTIIRSNEGGLTVAHYTKKGRDVWARVVLSGELVIEVADQGATFAEDKLKQALDREGHIAVYGIYFDVDKTDLRNDSEPTLQHILELLKDDTKLALEVQGHTDSTGERAHNQKLSEGRAESVKKWLVDHGITAARLLTKGFADTVPIADNKTPEGRARNRRVELAKRDLY